MNSHDIERNIEFSSVTLPAELRRLAHGLESGKIGVQRCSETSIRKVNDREIKLLSLLVLRYVEKGE